MKHFSSVALAAALIASLMFAQPCHAAYSSLWLVSYECDPAGLKGHRVWRVYARFSNPGDRLIAVYGIPASPATITATDRFYQHPVGGATAPNAALFDAFPTVEWDTFCTIGLARNVNGSDQTFTGPGFPRLPVTNHTNMLWGVLPSASGQAAPDSGGMVLIAQLTVPTSTSITNFNVGLSYRPAGSTSSVDVYNTNFVLLPLAAGDLNSDLQVNVTDLLLVLSTWGQTGQGIADANDDGAVDVRDLEIVIDHWGVLLDQCP